MSITNNYLSFFIFSWALFLSGCASWAHGDNANQTCLTLRQQIINNEHVTNGPNQQLGESPIKSAQLYKEYAQNNCPELVDSNKADPLPAAYSKPGLSAFKN